MSSLFDYFFRCACGVVKMKLLLSIIVGTSIMLSGLTPAFGISLLRGKTQAVNRWPYSFGDRYIYDNAGSRWNYDSAYKSKGYRYHHSNRHLRFKYNHKSPINEKFDRLIKHFSRHSFHHIRPSHPVRHSHHDSIRE